VIYIKLLCTFFKIGLFSFGGGYAMIPLIEAEITRNGWITHEAFIQIIGIAEMTPGPIAINAATFVGYQTAGLFGAIAATLGVAAPSLLIVLFISSFFFKHARHPVMKRIFYGIRPVVAGLILSAVISIGQTTVIHRASTGITFQPVTALIAVGAFIMIMKTKIHPIVLIVIAGCVSYMMSWLPL